MLSSKEYNTYQLEIVGLAALVDVYSVTEIMRDFLT